MSRDFFDEVWAAGEVQSQECGDAPAACVGTRSRQQLNEEYVMRYDNERGKGDHRHLGGIEEPIEFTMLDASFDAFEADAERIAA